MMNKLFFGFLLLFILMAPHAQAEIYKVIGADGKVTYADKPSQSATAKTEKMNFQSYAGSASVSSYNGSGKNVIMLSAEWCGVCTQAKAYMNSRKIEYESWDIDRSDFARSKMREVGAKGVSVILVGKEKMIGFSA